MKLRKGNELRKEMSDDNSLRITPISTGPARSEKMSVPHQLKLRGESFEFYYY
jgi:hypothetical protein